MKRFFPMVALMLCGLGLYPRFVIQTAAQSDVLFQVDHDAYTSYYDINTNCPSVVCYSLSLSDFSGSEKVSTRHFRIDTKLPKPRVKDSDYAHSGYVRGHLCAAADRDSRRAWLKQTYLTSNLVPMTMTCNSGAWKQVEDSIRMVVAQGHPQMICCGPVFSPMQLTQIGKTSVRVPVAFFKVSKCMVHPSEISVLLVDNNSSACYIKRFTSPLQLFQLLNDEMVKRITINYLQLWYHEE